MSQYQVRVLVNGAEPLQVFRRMSEPATFPVLHPLLESVKVIDLALIFHLMLSRYISCLVHLQELKRYESTRDQLSIKLPTTGRSDQSLITHYPSLITHYPSLITHYPSLITHR